MNESKSPSLSVTIQAIAMAYVLTATGFIWRSLLKAILDVDFSKDITSVINFAVAILGAYVIFPKLLKQPFGEVSLPDYLHRLGFYLPKQAWKHIALGIVLALCSVSGMLVGALLTGRYVLDWSNASFSHILFTTNPGVWEEFFFRGITMFVLLNATKSLKRASIIQIAIFALLHIKGFEFWTLVDALVGVSVIAIVFTYTAHKTGTLVAGIIFHFLHDALLFLVQVPGGDYIGTTENLIFYATLWPMLGVACLIIKYASEKLGVKAEKDLYQIEVS